MEARQHTSRTDEATGDETVSRSGECRNLLGQVSALAGLVAMAAGSAVAAAPAQPDAAALDKFLQTGVPFCMKAQAVQCIDRGFAFADRDGDGKLSVTEVATIEAQVDGWVKANADRVPQPDRQRLVLGLLLVHTMGPEQLVKSYDRDHDGQLSREEVTADIRLDKRTLPEILSDPASIDWGALSARAGDAAPLLKQLFQF